MEIEMFGRVEEAFWKDCGRERDFVRFETDGDGRVESWVKEVGRLEGLDLMSTSIPGRMERGLSSGHRADLIHCNKEINFLHAGKYPSSAMTSMEAWMIRIP